MEALTPLIELLVDAADASVRDRVLLEAVRTLGAARSAALWRMRDGSWQQIQAAGPQEWLPRASEVEAVASGSLPRDAFADKHIVSTCSGPTGLVLALGQIGADAALDTVEGLLFVFAAIAASEPESAQARVPAPLPSRSLPTSAAGSVGETQSHEELVSFENTRRVQHDLRNALTSLQTTRELLTRFSDGLSVTEQAHFQGVVERECQRIGQMLGNVARGPRTDIDTPSKACLAEVLLDVIDTERMALLEQGIQLDLGIDAEAQGAQVGAAAHQLSRMTRNLLVNAREALARGTQTGGTPLLRIQLALRDLRGRTMLVLCVEDNGPGLGDGNGNSATRVSLDTLPSLDQQDGGGRGLPIISEIVTELRGRMRTYANAWGGAGFEIQIPLAPRDAAKPS